VARRVKGVDGVAGKLLWADVGPDGACGGCIRDQLRDQTVHLVLCLGELIVCVEQDNELWRVWLAVTVSGSFKLDVGEGGQDRFKPFLGAIGPVPNFTKVG